MSEATPHGHGAEVPRTGRRLRRLRVSPVTLPAGVMMVRGQGEWNCCPDLEWEQMHE